MISFVSSILVLICTNIVVVNGRFEIDIIMWALGTQSKTGWATRLDLIDHSFLWIDKCPHLMLAQVVYQLAWRVGSSWWITRLLSMTWKTFLVAWETYIVNSTSLAHILPSSFIQLVPSCAAPWAWILLINSTIFLSECVYFGYRCVLMRHLYIPNAQDKRIHLGAL